jgi:predicted class III extradiol MEMO1 family dioxygenase
MLWDPTYKPRLRPVEAFPLHEGDGGTIGVRDRSGLSEVMLSLSAPALHIMSMMNGDHTCDDIRRQFQASFGRTLAEGTLHSMVNHLEKAHFLEGSGFEAYYQSLLDEYRSKRTREMPHAAALGIVDGSGSIFDEMLADVDGQVSPGKVVGLIAPHLDYPRGRPCYAAAYATLRNRPPPDRVIILGTNHFGRSTSVVATGVDFATPLGVTRVDTTFLGKLEERCGDLRTFELDHAREHSIELQVAWLQHFFSADAFTIVPLLCPDPCGPTIHPGSQVGPTLKGVGPEWALDGRGVDLREFALVLGELVRNDSGATLIVAGADLSHVGAAFGDERTLDEAFLEEVRQRDRQALDRLQTGEVGAFLQCVAKQENPTRVCSAGCIFVLATALPDASASVLDYHQAVDLPTQTCVTCAAVAFT